MTVDLTAQIHQYLTTASGSNFAQQEVTMLEAWEGDANLLWRVRAGDEMAVVKLFLDAGQARSRRQFDGHRIFAPLGLAPQPLWQDRYPTGLARQLIVYRWCEGKPVDPSDASELEAWAAAIGTLHAASIDEVQRFSPHPLNLATYWRIEQGSIAQIQAWLAHSEVGLGPIFDQMATATTRLVDANLPLWSAAMPAAVHGDITLDHSLYARGQITLLDWEMFGLGDPALDVARGLQHAAQDLTQEQAAAWLAHYLSVNNPPGVAERIAVYRQLLDVHNVIYLLVGLHQHTIKGVDDALRGALPYLQAALTAALDQAAATVQLSLDVSAGAIAAELMEWLLACAALPR